MNSTAVDDIYMNRALQLAQQGALTAAPNPIVGAVIVARGRIIGEGYHIRPGEGHAEVNAVASVREEDFPLLSESTLYVTLEPCAHYGRTPPCAKLIIEKRIRRCVVGCIDPFAAVKGRGVAMLREAGVEVTVGVLEDACLALNRRFITFHTLHRPSITLKWARTSDGYIDRRRTSGQPLHISTPQTQMHVHRLRSMHQAILVGARTWRLDSPRLDLRRWFGTPPRRCVLGHVAPDALPPDVICHDNIPDMLSDLYRQGCQSLLVEGGRATLQSFIDQGLWDEAWEECGEMEIGDGVPCPQMPREADRIRKIWNVTFNYWKQEGVKRLPQ